MRAAASVGPLAGPKRIGLRPDRPFVHRLAVDRDQPVVAVDGLPPGMIVDRARRVISGSTGVRGSHTVVVSGDGSAGTWTDTIELVVGSEICLTPPLGWNSWNVFGAAITEDDVRRAALALIDSGLADRGWSTVNIDDGWQGERNRRGRLQPNDKFRDLSTLCADLHDLGLRVGIYSSPGPTTCAGFAGSAGFEAEDAGSFAEWGFDYLKYDWCSAGPIDDTTPLDTLIAPYARMRDALDRVERDIVYHVCQYGFGDVWAWARHRVGANSWRTTGDIEDTWASVAGIGFGQAGSEGFAGPGGWNDPDMLVIGALGGAWGHPIGPTRLTHDEQRTHVGLWVLLAAPLLLGCDLSLLDEPTLELVTNRELLAVHQDPLGRQAAPIRSEGGVEVWRKTLVDGSSAIGIFNRSDSAAAAAIAWRDLDLRPHTVRDLWARRAVEAGESWQEVLPAHGCAVLRAW